MFTLDKREVVSLAQGIVSCITFAKDRWDVCGFIVMGEKDDRLCLAWKDAQGILNKEVLIEGTVSLDYVTQTETDIKVIGKEAGKPLSISRSKTRLGLDA